MMRKQIAMAAALMMTGICMPSWSNPLQEELKGLLDQHPMIKSARKSVEASESSLSATRGGYYPRVSVNSDTGKESIETATDTNLQRRRYAISLEQNLIAGGRTKASVDIANDDVAIQRNQLDSATQTVLLEGITAYLQVARYQNLIAIARRNEATTQRQLKLEDERVSRGGGIAVDVLQAKTRLQISKERRVFYEQGYRDAMANYGQVFGHAPDVSRMQEIDVPMQQLPSSLDEAIALGQNKNSSLVESRLQSQRAIKAIGSERSGFFPVVDLVATQSHEKNVNQVPRRNETSLLVRLNWSLFSGGETYYRESAARKQSEALTEREAGVTRKVEESVRVSWNQLVNNRERQDLLENAGNIAFETMQHRKRLRDAGKETALNVLDAENEYYGVIGNKINALYDARIGGYRLLQAIGRLNAGNLGVFEGSFAVPLKPLNLDVEEPK